MDGNKDTNKYIDPVTISIFGATGDLAKNKLFPALFNLYKNNHFKSQFYIVGFSRRPWDDIEFQKYVSEILLEKNKQEVDLIKEFVSHIYYVSGDIEKKDSYISLQKKIRLLDDKENACLNKIFYLAITPHYYETSITFIHEVGLTIPCVDIESNNTEWTRVFIEKPFGNDRDQAQKLDMLLGTLFDESQIFRIDHYLGKETLQNILSFRFANSIFEKIWDKDSIEKIEVRIIESNTVGTRGKFYDETGALRDVGQNHLLQMVALTTMENPLHMSGNSVREERAKILESIQYHPTDKSLYIAQYEGYMDSIETDISSLTETYFRVQVSIENEKFRGVPILLESGKGFGQPKTEIVIYFKKDIHSLCQLDSKNKTCQNKLTFSIYPKEEIVFDIFVKKVGFENIVMDTKLKVEENTSSNSPDAYERILFDGLKGDQTLFASTKEVLAQWNIVTEILKQYKNTPLKKYPLGLLDPSEI